MPKNKKTSYTTENGFRVYRCKRCGSHIEEPLLRFRTKPQKLKNVCKDCLDKARVAELTREERLRAMSYSGLF